jgi:pimeloyl-ACP methyl ester carboxylesterase
MKGRNIALSTFSIILIITLSFGIMTVPFAYSQTNQTSSFDVQNIPAKKVHVGDIDIAYKVFGKGDPLLLISGLGATKDGWDPSTLRELSLNHTVITFDSRGIGNTTTGTKAFSVQQFANDTAGLLNALKIQKADILGYSLGSFVAQQLAVTHPEKVNRLVLVAATCGGKEAVPQNPQLQPTKLASEMLIRFINNISIAPQEVKTLLSYNLGSGWMKLHPNYFETNPIPKAKDLFGSNTSFNTLKQQYNVVVNWLATNWSGICDELTKISSPTLIITGTDDVGVPTANSLIIETLPLDIACDNRRWI